jgi:hypothetical protein
LAFGRGHGTAVALVFAVGNHVWAEPIIINAFCPDNRINELMMQFSLIIAYALELLQSAPVYFSMPYYNSNNPTGYGSGEQAETL